MAKMSNKKSQLNDSKRRGWATAVGGGDGGSTAVGSVAVGIEGGISASSIDINPAFP